MMLAVATLLLGSRGVEVVDQDLRRTVDPHWQRGLSYLKLGLRAMHWALISIPLHSSTLQKSGRVPTQKGREGVASRVRSAQEAPECRLSARTDSPGQAWPPITLNRYLFPSPAGRINPLNTAPMFKGCIGIYISRGRAVSDSFSNHPHHFCQAVRTGASAALSQQEPLASGIIRHLPNGGGPTTRLESPPEQCSPFQLSVSSSPLPTSNHVRKML